MLCRAPPSHPSHPVRPVRPQGLTHGLTFSCRPARCQVNVRRTCRPCLASSSSSSQQSSQSDDLDVERLERDLTAVVIVPGFLCGSKIYEPLVQAMRERGVPATVVPLSAADWLPCAGGRSVRPILERIDSAVRHAAASGKCATEVVGIPDTQLAIPPPRVTPIDRFVDFRNTPGGPFSVGGSQKPDEFPTVLPRGDFPPPPGAPVGRVALVGHSAGGWISRVYLSNRAYGGRVYGGSNLVHSLVTLGTPHAPASGVAFESHSWLHRDRDTSDLERRVRMLAVGSAGYGGGDWGDFTRNSYAFCVGEEGESDEATRARAELLCGDGVTPLSSALDLPGAEQLILDDAISHAPGYPSFVSPELAADFNARQTWYGSDAVLDQWLAWLKDHPLKNHDEGSA
ncbi:GPI inositol-deacylase [Pseudoscourfieldia marina]